MALNLKDFPPALQAKILAAMGPLPPEPQYAMATFIQGNWTIGPFTTNRKLIARLVRRHNLMSPVNARRVVLGEPSAVLITTHEG